MTAIEADVAPARWSLLRAITPAEGWTALALTALMSATVAWSLDDAAWVLDNPRYGDFFIWASLLATLVGFAGAMTRWPRWIVHFIGAVIAALVLPVLVGAVLVPDGTPQEMFHATAVAVVNAWYDLAILDLAVTPQIGHYLLAIGIIVWSVGQFAAYTVFGHRRSLDAVIVVGILLLANMAMTAHDQLHLLVVFSLAALLLLARTHAVEEQALWLRRRIGDASSVRSLYLRGGVAFVTVAVLGSLALTASASSAPLAGAWVGFGDRLIELSQGLQRYLPFGGASRPIGFGFGNSAPISGSWNTNTSPVATIRLPKGDTTKYYWRVAAYDQFQNQAWAWTAAREINRSADQPALANQADDPTAQGLRSRLTFTVDPAGAGNIYAMSPQDADSVSQDSRLFVVGKDGYFSALQLSNPGASYEVSALLPVTKDEPGGRTQNRLRSAGTDYPADVKALYLQVPAAAIGPNARALLDEIVAASPTKKPFDLASTMESRLRQFHYNQNVVGKCPPGESAVECFATIKEGYCLYYASTMAIFLREEGVPARLVQGFLPGTRDSSGNETILASRAHAWVEVYFPGFGWQMFDPTGGSLASNTPLAVGDPVPSATAAPSGDVSGTPRATRRDPEPRGGGSTGGGTTPGTRSGPGLMIALAVLLLAGFGGLAFVAWQRGTGSAVSAEAAWRSVGRMAARFGFGPRPTQTVYEYAGALGDVLPAARPSLETVARAKVEVAYGRRTLATERLARLRDAQRHLRVDLLRLALKREERRRRRRGG
jgi:transglutaminase-like putative cysteine protease